MENTNAHIHYHGYSKGCEGMWKVNAAASEARAFLVHELEKIKERERDLIEELLDIRRGASMWDRAILG